MNKFSAVLVALVLACAVVYGSDTVTEHSFSIPNGGGIEKIDGVHLTNVTWNGSAVTVGTIAVCTNATATVTLTQQRVTLTDTNGVIASVVTNVTGVVTVTPLTKTISVLQ